MVLAGVHVPPVYPTSAGDLARLIGVTASLLHSRRRSAGAYLLFKGARAGGFLASRIDQIKTHKHDIIHQHAHPEDRRGLLQVTVTLALLALAWSLAARSRGLASLLLVLPLSLLTLRVFALMHDCGHGVLFRSRRLNQGFGFVLGVLAGMPQYVWSRNHSYHHLHNGNWDRYRGPYTTLALEEYAALSPGQQRLYRWKCSMTCAPLAGFIYLLFNPRYTWLRGSAGLAIHVVRGKLACPERSLRSHAEAFRTRYWKSLREYRHMTWNNLVLFALWALMCRALGVAHFFGIYALSLSLAGAAGIMLFTVQHNFRHAYASGEAGWDADVGALDGTSYLVLPRWLNWVTADIGYHHVHHLSARIPNYCLARCHQQYRELFTQVTRIRLREVPRALQYILWDRAARQLVSVAEYQQGGARALQREV